MAYIGLAISQSTSWSCEPTLPIGRSCGYSVVEVVGFPLGFALGGFLLYTASKMRREIENERAFRRPENSPRDGQVSKEEAERWISQPLTPAQSKPAHAGRGAGDSAQDVPGRQPVQNTRTRNTESAGDARL